ncbi:serine/threonine-protein kinase [Argonema antarcticum]|uniref:serine/threonine-protein kinase n=1 Tax=Argonema antarcticum TaxID=2942763 RepID=UPI00201188FE|nr:serine/threonine-protein kinase [Argonema antarcticum]MCL1475135.1 GUN4 domain-containing protein [Argonema antarcticum A004/B2]
MAWNRGDTLKDGKYTIRGVLGQGGFGITYRVRDENGRQFALKTLNDNAIAEPNFAKLHEDFMNEALRLAQFKNHPHIVKIYKLLQETIRKNNLFSSISLCCILMEYIEGTTLEKLVEKGGAIPEAEAVRYIQQIGNALTAIHQEGLLHRDVKPSNIILRASNSEAVLIDFGIAREFTGDRTLRHTEFVTPGFAPIEQYDPDATRGEYTDVYALAATLYYLVTGKVPTTTSSRLINTPLKPVKQIVPNLSDRLHDAIVWGMELLPQRRPQSVQSWLKLLGKSAPISQPQPAKTSPVPPAVNFSLILQPQVPPPPPPADDLSSDKGIDYRKLRDFLKAGNWKKADEETLSSDKGIDYRKLRDFLKAGNWKKADEETLKVMLKVAGREKKGWLDIPDIDNFPCTDLRTIDQLWVKYSKGRFGFSVQKRIWQSVGGKPGVWDYEIARCNEFGNYVGWYESVLNYWLDYSKLDFSLNARVGHLPCAGVTSVRKVNGLPWTWGLNSFFSRVETCKV